MYFGVWEEVHSHFNGEVFVFGSYSLSQVVIMQLERKGEISADHCVGGHFSWTE